MKLTPIEIAATMTAIEDSLPRASQRQASALRSALRVLETEMFAVA